MDYLYLSILIIIITLAFVTLSIYVIIQTKKDMNKNRIINKRKYDKLHEEFLLIRTNLDKTNATIKKLKLKIVATDICNKMKEEKGSK